MANKVIVQPGGKTFTTIQTAIDSITDASEKLWYSVLCSPGTYNERVILKPWVFVIGMDESADNTIITADTKQGTPIMAASNSGVTACTIISTATSATGYPCAVECNGAVNFRLTGCKAYTKHGPEHFHPRMIHTVAMNIYDGRGDVASMVISSCEIHQECEANSDGPSMEAVAGGEGSTMNVYNSKISCINSPCYAGALFALGGNIEAIDCNISCPKMALDIGAEGGTLKAVNCNITGGIGKGVIVVNK